LTPQILEKRVSKRFGRTETQLTILLFCSLFANGLLARKVYDNNREMTRNSGRLEIGAEVPVLTGIDLDGTDRSIDPRLERRTVLYVFAPSCGWCGKNLANMKAVATASRAKGFRFVAVSVVDDQVRKYVSENGIDVPVLIASPQAKDQYHLGATPHTIVISSEGRVERSWRGAYAGPISDEVGRYFGTTLPGLLEIASRK
jgi:peroxiredoxin